MGNRARSYAGQHEQVETHRRRDLCHFHHENDEDAEQIRSMPAACTVGSTPMVSTTMEMPSGSSPG